MTLDYGIYCIVLIMGNAGFVSSTVTLVNLFKAEVAGQRALRNSEKLKWLRVFDKAIADWDPLDAGRRHIFASFPLAGHYINVCKTCCSRPSEVFGSAGTKKLLETPERRRAGKTRAMR